MLSIRCIEFIDHLRINVVITGATEAVPEKITPLPFASGGLSYEVLSHAVLRFSRFNSYTGVISHHG
jgi:hypothetical protein